MKLKNLNCDETQKLKNLQTQSVMKLKNSNCDKTQKFVVIKSDLKSLIVVSFYITIEKYNLIVHRRLSTNFTTLP